MDNLEDQEDSLSIISTSNNTSFNNNMCSMKPSIVFDLDDTLIHRTNFESEDSFAIFVKKRQVNILIRNGVEAMLEKLHQIYDLYIFTSSKKEYADQIIDRIAPFIGKNYRFYYDSMKFCKKIPFKDLTLLGRNVNLEQMLLIDDTPKSGLRQPTNVVVVKKWTGNENDNVMTNELLPLLLAIANEANLPKSIRQQSLLQATKSISFWNYR